MRMRTIPHTQLQVSPICLGTMLFGNPVGTDDAVGLVHWALDRGINFIDTADMYQGYDRYLGSPGGVAETILGSVLTDRRDRIVVTTKVGNAIGGGGYEGTGLGRKLSHGRCELNRRHAKIEQLAPLHWIVLRRAVAGWAGKRCWRRRRWRRRRWGHVATIILTWDRHEHTPLRSQALRCN